MDLSALIGILSITVAVLGVFVPLYVWAFKQEVKSLKSRVNDVESENKYLQAIYRNLGEIDNTATRLKDAISSGKEKAEVIKIQSDVAEVMDDVSEIIGLIHDTWIEDQRRAEFDGKTVTTKRFKELFEDDPLIGKAVLIGATGPLKNLQFNYKVIWPNGTTSDHSHDELEIVKENKKNNR